MEEISMSAGISKSEALRCFRQSMQTTPYRYLMDYRLSKAASLLSETEIQVSEVMIRCGFHQQSYFGKCFKERIGMSPKSYQKATREKNQ
jgi:transcriptional regulator GlxA family with amidase domain